MDGRLAGRTALVTGAAGDIGRATAVRLSGAGATVVLADRHEAADRLAETAGLCQGDTTTRLFDVADEPAVDAAVREIAHSFGAPDAIFNNAGIQGQFANTLEYDADDMRRVLEVNVVGVFVVLRACARALVEAGEGGAVVNTASMAGVAGPPNMVAYTASKSAVIGLTKTAANDLAPVGIRVNSVSPAFIGPGAMWDRQVELQAEVPSQYYADDAATVARQMIGQVPLRRYGSLEEVAAAVEFLLSDDASYITGFNLEVSGGLS